MPALSLPVLLEAVAGATVHASAANVDIIYPSADFQSAGMATSALGIFLIWRHRKR